jgi:uncharacterized membrane protein
MRLRHAQRAAGALLLIACVAIGLASLRYASGDASIAPPPLRASMAANGWVFVAHAVASAIALIIGPFQLSSALRDQRPARHRWLGRIYAACCIAGAAAALWIAPDAVGGPIATAGFAALAVLWVATTAIGVQYAIRGEIAAHRGWMIRSFALTASAVSLRLLMVTTDAVAGLGYAQLSHVFAWCCWLPQLIAVEAWLALVRRAPPSTQHAREPTTLGSPRHSTN